MTLHGTCELLVLGCWGVVLAGKPGRMVQVRWKQGRCFVCTGVFWCVSCVGWIGVLCWMVVLVVEPLAGSAIVLTA